MARNQPQAYPAAFARQPRKVRLFPGRYPEIPFGLQRDQSEGRIVTDHGFDWQLVMHGGEEFAHQRIETTPGIKVSS
jgi:hypothetical protein